jgi:hypothetical protein
VGLNVCDDSIGSVRKQNHSRVAHKNQNTCSRKSLKLRTATSSGVIKQWNPEILNIALDFDYHNMPAKNKKLNSTKRLIIHILPLCSSLLTSYFSMSSSLVTIYIYIYFFL